MRILFEERSFWMNISVVLILHESNFAQSNFIKKAYFLGKQLLGSNFVGEFFPSPAQIF